MKKLLLTLTLFITSINYLSAMVDRTPIAKVEKIRGDVTQLVPGERTARKVLETDSFIEDTSIVTAAKSFIKIKFIDNSEVNVGPESKIVISEMKKDSAGVISLLKGKIRTEVEKSTEKVENKFFIKTRTAAMGVRGTEFQTIYNPENKVTSLLTYKGEVAMAKIDETQYQKIENAPVKEIIRDDATNAPELVEGSRLNNNESKELNKILKSKETVIVPSGQNSFASDSLKKSSLPVKISPVQLEVLYKNEEFKENSKENLKSKSAQDLKNINTELKVAEQKAPLEGVFNSKTGDFAPKAGGFIDLNTGLYVAPDTDATLDTKHGVYVAKKVGTVDADTGQYIAPTGLVLDAKKGFVLDKGEEKKPELLALKEDLNTNIKKDYVVGKFESEEKEQFFNLEEKFIRDRISLTLSSGEEVLRLNENESNRPFIEYGKKYYHHFKLEWIQNSPNRLALFSSVDYGLVKYTNHPSYTLIQSSNKKFALNFGLLYALSKKFNLYVKTLLNQDHYLEEFNSTYPQNFKLTKLMVTGLEFGFRSEFFRENVVSLDVDFGIALTARKHYNNIIVRPGSGIEFSVLPKYKLRDKTSVAFGLEHRSMNQKIDCMEINNQKRESNNLVLKYLVDL